MREETKPTWREVHGGFAKDMTLRDHYAGLAMQAQLSMPEVFAVIGNKDITIATLCGSCFAWADAMLAAREAK